MTSTPIDNAALISFKLTEDQTTEPFQFGCKLVKVDPADFSALLDDCETWWTDNVGPHTVLCHLKEITYSEWETSGFVGFHQVQSKLVNDAATNAAALPPQCAVTLSLLNTDEPAVSIKSRRGRIYIGLLPDSSMDGGGRISTTYRTAMTDALVALQTMLVTHVSGTADFSGLGIASPTTGTIYKADSYGVGLAIDTQRRRRQKMVESISYATF